MADNKEVEEVVKFLESRGIGIDVISKFEKEKMDSEAIIYASESCLQDFGLQAKGDILALKAFAQRRHNSGSNENPVYDEKKRKLIEILRKGRDTRGQPNKKTKEESVTSTTVNKERTRKITLGWMHYNSSLQKYVTVRITNGGGTRRIDLALTCSKEDIIEEAKKLFFPDGVSSQGDSRNMEFNLSSFQGNVIPEFIADPAAERKPFTLQRYIEEHKLTQIRLYLTSKPEDTHDDDDDDDRDLMNPVFGSSKDKREKWLTYLNTHVNDDKEDAINVSSSSESDSETESTSQRGRLGSTTVTVTDAAKEVTEAKIKPRLNPLLVGSSEERQESKKEQDEQYQRSLEEDRAKEEKKKELQLEEEKKSARLESIRLARSMRVPPEPESETPRVRVAVNHLTNGKLVRYFKQHEKMLAVYDWIGSQALLPEHFHLCSCPGQTVKPSDEVRDCILYMEVADEAVMAIDDPEICFKGYDFGKDDCDLDFPFSNIDSLIQDIDQSVNENFNNVSFGGEADSTAVEELNTDYIKLDEKRQEARNGLKDVPVFVIVKREHVVRELMELYKDSSIINKQIVADIEGEGATGDGVLREVYSLFWDGFLPNLSDGYSEFTVPVGPSLGEEDYVILGRIITHQFIQCGTFPLRIAQASIQHLLTGYVSDECKINSFSRILPPNERECLARALSGEGVFPKEEMIDILEDFNLRQLPSSGNIKTLVLQAAVAEFITKPYLGLVKIREGMGSFWDSVEASEIASLYKLCVPTIPGVIESLIMVPVDPKGSQIFRWLERYIRGLSDDILVKFIRFSTATDVLLPNDSISVSLEVMPPAAIRPRAYTCFRKLIVPKNYHSYAQLRSNMDFYLRDCQLWDLND